MFLGPWHLLFGTCTCFFLDLAQWGYLDIVARCMQEVVDAGEIRILNNINGRSGGEANGVSLHIKPNGCRKLRGTWGGRES